MLPTIPIAPRDECGFDRKLYQRPLAKAGNSGSVGPAGSRGASTVVSASGSAVSLAYVASADSLAAAAGVVPPQPPASAREPRDEKAALFRLLPHEDTVRAVYKRHAQNFFEEMKDGFLREAAILRKSSHKALARPEGHESTTSLASARGRDPSVAALAARLDKQQEELHNLARHMKMEFSCAKKATLTPMWKERALQNIAQGELRAVCADEVGKVFEELSTTAMDRQAEVAVLRLSEQGCLPSEAKLRQELLLELQQLRDGCRRQLEELTKQADESLAARAVLVQCCSAMEQRQREGGERLTALEEKFEALPTAAVFAELPQLIAGHKEAVGKVATLCRESSALDTAIKQSRAEASDRLEPLDAGLRSLQDGRAKDQQDVSRRLEQLDAGLRSLQDGRAKDQQDVSGRLEQLDAGLRSLQDGRAKDQQELARLHSSCAVQEEATARLSEELLISGAKLREELAARHVVQQRELDARLSAALGSKDGRFSALEHEVHEVRKEHHTLRETAASAKQTAAAFTQLREELRDAMRASYDTSERREAANRAADAARLESMSQELRAAVSDALQEVASRSGALEGEVQEARRMIQSQRDWDAVTSREIESLRLALQGLRDTEVPELKARVIGTIDEVAPVVTELRGRLLNAETRLGTAERRCDAIQHSQGSLQVSVSEEKAALLEKVSQLERAWSPKFEQLERAWSPKLAIDGDAVSPDEGVECHAEVFKDEFGLDGLFARLEMSEAVSRDATRVMMQISEQVAEATELAREAKFSAEALRELQAEAEQAQAEAVVASAAAHVATESAAQGVPSAAAEPRAGAEALEGPLAALRRQLEDTASQLGARLQLLADTVARQGVALDVVERQARQLGLERAAGGSDGAALVHRTELCEGLVQRLREDVAELRRASIAAEPVEPGGGGEDCDHVGLFSELRARIEMAEAVCQDAVFALGCLPELEARIEGAEEATVKVREAVEAASEEARQVREASRQFAEAAAVAAATAKQSAEAVAGMDAHFAPAAAGGSTAAAQLDARLGSLERQLEDLRCALSTAGRASSGAAAASPTASKEELQRLHTEVQDVRVQVLALGLVMGFPLSGPVPAVERAAAAAAQRSPRAPTKSAAGWRETAAGSGSGPADLHGTDLVDVRSRALEALMDSLAAEPSTCRAEHGEASSAASPERQPPPLVMCFASAKGEEQLTLLSSCLVEPLPPPPDGGASGPSAAAAHEEHMAALTSSVLLQSFSPRVVPGEEVADLGRSRPASSDLNSPRLSRGGRHTVSQQSLASCDESDIADGVIANVMGHKSQS